MTKVEIGKYMNINAWLQILLPLLTFEFYSSLTLARYDYKDEFDHYTSSTLIYGLIVSSIIGAVFLIFSATFEQLFSMDHYTLVITVLYIVFFPALQYYQTIAMFRYEHKKVAFITMLNLIVPLAFSLLFALTWKNRLAGRIVGYYVPTIMICLVLLILYIYRGKGVSFKYLSYALKISFPLIWHVLAIHMLATGDRIVITKVLGDESNALYTIAYTVCGIVTILWSSMNSAWSAWCTERMHFQDSSSLRRMGKPYLLFFAAIMVVVLLIAPEVLLLMGGGKGYYEARFVIPPILIGLVSQFVYSMYVNIEFYYKKQVRISIGTIIATVLNVGLNIIFVPKFGYIAAAYTTLFGYLTLLLYHFLAVKISKLGEWYDDKFNLLVVSVFLLSLPLFIYLYDHSVIRYAVLATYAVVLSFVAFRNKDKLIAAWKKLR